MYFITTKRMLEVCFSAHPNIQYRTFVCKENSPVQDSLSVFHFCVSFLCFIPAFCFGGCMKNVQLQILPDVFMEREEQFIYIWKDGAGC